MVLPARIALFTLLCLTLLMSACATKGPDTPTEHIPPPHPGKTSAHPPDARRIVVQTAQDSIGTAYTWGGHNPSQGFDCSGLVFYAHQNAGIHVPRTAADQFQKGKKVSKKGLLPGDLVFFNTPNKKTSTHVGIFVGNRYFVHAPGRGRQVMRTSLSNPYFKKHFKGARSFF